MAVTCFVKTVLFCFGIDFDILSYLGGASFLTLVFLYVSSYVFKFCTYHRICLHYVTVMNIISLIDLYVGIPVNNIGLLIISLALTAAFICLIFYFYKNEHFSEKTYCQDASFYC